LVTLVTKAAMETSAKNLVMNVRRSSCKLCVVFVQFQQKFLHVNFYFNSPMSNFTQTYPMGVELFHADRQSDEHTVMKKGIVYF
jgi:hypothetical protein